MALDKLCTRLQDVFEAHFEAVAALDLQQIEAAQRKFALARDRAEGILRDVQRGAGEGVTAAKLQPSDVSPYRDVLAKEAAVSVPDRSAEVVHRNLDYVGILLRQYHHAYGRFPPITSQPAQGGGRPNPPTFDAWIRHLPTDWRIDHVDGSDHEIVRRLFVVPGDDPDKKATSYEVVSADRDSFVLRTPVLANGKRFEASYRAERKEIDFVNGTKQSMVFVKRTISEIK